MYDPKLNRRRLRLLTVAPALIALAAASCDDPFPPVPPREVVGEYLMVQAAEHPAPYCPGGGEVCAVGRIDLRADGTAEWSFGYARLGAHTRIVGSFEATRQGNGYHLQFYRPLKTPNHEGFYVDDRIVVEEHLFTPNEFLPFVFERQEEEGSIGAVILDTPATAVRALPPS